MVFHYLSIGDSEQQFAFDPAFGPPIKITDEDGNPVGTVGDSLIDDGAGDYDPTAPTVEVDVLAGLAASTADKDMGGGSITNVNLVDSRNVSVDGTKLDTVETNADVTDETNVIAGLTASGTAKDMGGGNITNVGTVDGRTLATDGTKLDAIEAAADVTDATNVEAAGAVMDSDNPILDADITEGEGMLRKTGAGAYEAIKSNLSASTAPGTGDDDVSGYAEGSIWLDLTADDAYICLDKTTSTAVWKKMTP